MAQEQFVSITIFKDQKKGLFLSDFINFKQIVSLDQIKNIEIPCSNFAQTINQQQVSVLNILLYFIIFVESSQNVLKNDVFGDNYRILCVNQISHYYIKNGMSIELRQFAFLAGVILDVKFHQCAHIIFYLVYGTFASHPYIKTLCEHVKGVNMFNINKSKSKRRLQSHPVFKRKTYNFSTELEFNEFYKELKAALQPKQQKSKIKREFINRHSLQQQKTQDQMKNDHQNFQKERINERQHQKMKNILSIGINKTSNSFIVSNLPQNQTQLIFKNISNKSLARKKKFNDFLRTSRLKQKQKTFKTSQLTKKQTTKLARTFELKQFEIGKIKINDLKSIFEQLKSQNQQFDQARLYCNLKQKEFNVEKPQSIIQQEKKEKSNIKVAHIELQQVFQKHKQQQNLNQRLNLSKKNSKQENISIPKFKQGDYSNLLLVEQTKRDNERKDQGKNEFFAQSFFGWKRINCRKQVQKYKSQFRRFLSVQLLQKIINANQNDEF